MKVVAITVDTTRAITNLQRDTAVVPVEFEYEGGSRWIQWMDTAEAYKEITKFEKEKKLGARTHRRE